MLPPEATATSVQPSTASTPLSASRSVSIGTTPPVELSESSTCPVISES